MSASPGMKMVILQNLRWNVRADEVESGWMDVLENPENYLKDVSRALKHSKTVTVMAIEKRDRCPGLVLRRLNYGQRKHKIKDLLRPSRVIRSLKQGMQLEAAGVRTPRALAAATVRRFFWPVRAYFLMEKVENAVALRDLVIQRRRLAILAEALAETLARMHEAGYSHRDLKMTNILVQDEKIPWIIDLDGLRRFGKVPEKRAYRDIARIAEDLQPWWPEYGRSALRFLIRYCRARNSGDARRAGKSIMKMAAGKSG